MDEQRPDRCSFCRGPYHPATGHRYSDTARACGPCTREVVRWLKGMMRRKWGGQFFYDVAARTPADVEIDLFRRRALGECMAEVENEKLKALMDAASEIDSPHVDLSSIGIPVKVGLADLHKIVLNHEAPSIKIDLGNAIGDSAEIVISHVDGGVMATLQGKF